MSAVILLVYLLAVFWTVMAWQYATALGFGILAILHWAVVGALAYLAFMDEETP